MTVLSETKLPGRPRCEETRSAILRAAHELLEAGGLGAFTIEAVAERSGAAKTTIYRWWPNKGALAMESLLGVADTLSPFPETESPGPISGCTSISTPRRSGAGPASC